MLEYTYIIMDDSMNWRDWNYDSKPLKILKQSFPDNLWPGYHCTGAATGYGLDKRGTVRVPVG
jgi:hypothetical protein